jgi:cytochrome c-type biogenesis protein CcmE
MNKKHKLEKLAKNIFGLLSYQEKLIQVDEENFTLQLYYTKTVAELFRRELNLLQQGVAIQSKTIKAMKLLKEHHDETQRISRNHLSQQNQFIKMATNAVKKQFSQ